MNKRGHIPNRWIQVVQSSCIAIAMVLLTVIATGQNALATSVYDIPMVSTDAQQWVVDQGEILSRVTQSSLNKQLDSLASDTGTQTHFVTIRWLDYGDTAESFSEKLFKEWFPTDAEQSNQALLLLDTKTNTAAMYKGPSESGYLTDDIAQSIAKETLLIPIRKGSYNQGLLDASSRLTAVLSGQEDPGPPVIEVVDIESTFKSADETDAKSATVIVAILVVLATVIPMATYYWYQAGS